MAARGTRSVIEENRRQFERILTSEFGLESNHPIILTLKEESVLTFEDLPLLSPDDIDGLSYTTYVEIDGENAAITNDLVKGHKGWIKALIAFMRYYSLDTPEKMDTVSLEDFNKFRMGIYSPINNNQTYTPFYNKPSNKNKGSLSYSETFKKSIKKDRSTYPTLREDKQWDKWNRSIKALARTHDCEEVFDTNYVPVGNDQEAAFQEKQKFIYSVFEDKVLTNTGKTLVRKFEETYDAQSIYKGLLHHSKESTQATIDIAELLTYITTVKLHKISWKGTYYAFILHWCDKLRLYEDMVDIQDHFTHKLKKIMLQNVVAGVASLNQVKTQSDHDKAHGKPELTYDSYVTLLLSAASTHDAKVGFTSKTKLRLYAAKQMNYNTYSTEYNQDPNCSYDIDSDCIMDENTQEIYETSIIPYKQPRPAINGPKMTRDKWLSLSKPEQQAWDTFSNKSKAIILGLTAPQPNTFKNESTSRDINKLMNNFTTDDMVADDKSFEKDEETIKNHNNNKSELLSFLTNQEHPGDIRNVLSVPKQENSTSTNKPKDFKDRKVNTSEIIYSVSTLTTDNKGSLIDRGANGGLAGKDVRIICSHDPPRYIDVSGINNHKVQDLEIVTAGGVVPSNRGPVIIIMHQYAYLGKGDTIHSCIQLEDYKNKVDDRAITLNGTQTITTQDGYIHPLNFINGLAYLQIRPYTDSKWETLPHVIWTSDKKWDPTSIDYSLTNDDNWPRNYPTNPNDNNDRLFNEIGEYVHTSELNNNDIEYLQQRLSILDVNRNEIIIRQYQTQSHATNKAISTLKTPNIHLLRPYFLYMEDDIIKRTIDATTQYGRTNSNALQLRQTYRTPFPACNVTRRNEPVATDTVYSTTPAIDNGSKIAQIYVGRQTLVTDIYAMKTEKEFIHTLQENIRKRGAMDTLISDRAKTEISKQCHDILRAYCIKDWQSEPYYQHQNYAERKYAQIKPLVNRLLNTTGAPPELWLLALEHVVRTLNHTANKTLGWRTPIQALSGTKPDISAIIIFHFWESIYYKHINAEFPHDSNEKIGRFVGVADNVGHALTYKILSDENTILYRSKIRSATKTDVKNRRLEPNVHQEYIKSKFNRETMLPTINPDELIGKTFLREPSEDGTRLRAKIVERIKSMEDKISDDPKFIRFRCTVNDGEFEDFVTYMDVINHIEKEDEENDQWKFKSITGHQGPLSKSDAEYKGSRYNVLVNWNSGESTYEPLDLIAKDDPITCAIYAKNNNLLQQTGWKRFKRILSREREFNCMINKVKIHKEDKDNYQFGVLIPRNHNHAMELDMKAGNNKWYNAEQTELKQIYQYNTFIDKGKNFDIPPDYTKIKVHFVYAVKHDGRYKARLVAGGHLTAIPDDSIYSGVVSLKGIRIIIFLAKLNNLPVYSTDIGNAYLEASTKEKVYIIAGSEFGELEGHTLIMNKALYGLRSSGLRWHEHLADSLREMKFTNTKAENDIWMRRNGQKYEYIASYVDDLCIVAKEPEKIINYLQNVCQYKLKGTGPISFHLGCNYFNDNDQNLCYAPRKYIEKLIEDYIHMFGHKPKFYWSPLDHGDHPEIDTTEELDENGTKQYQSMIGSLQWAVALGRFDISTAVMTLSSFRASPRKGHLIRAKRIYGYLAKFKDSAIRIRTSLPDYTNMQFEEYDWQSTTYGNIEEIIPSDIPPPLGNTVQLTTYVDANLFRDILTGRSVTCILHVTNKTPFDSI